MSMSVLTSIAVQTCACVFVCVHVSLSGVRCSFLVFLLLSVAHRNPPGSRRIRAYRLGLQDRKVDDEWQRGAANANGDL